MDNVPFHKSKEVIALIEKSKNIPLFIPPYSPEFNGIENIFSILKSKVRRDNIDSNKIETTIKKNIKELDKYDINKIYNSCLRKKSK